jgi:2-polyprenyl-6-methoxyphenol hydroxylase-like FAD-dependent oxidoreductase
MSFEQNNEGVMIRCSDNTTHHGDILVGADGAYSGVRQHLFKVLKKKKKFLRSDNVPLPFSTVCLVGQTEVLDPEVFPHLKMEESQFLCVFGPSSMYSVSFHFICWHSNDVPHHLYLQASFRLVMGYLYYKT